MGIIRFVESRISKGLGLALPVLVVVSCFLPLLGLMLGAAAVWLAPAIIALAAVGASTFLLRERGAGAAIALSAFSVAAGTGMFFAITLGLNALGGSQDQSVIDLASRLVTAIPLVLVVLALLAIVLTTHALPGSRRLLGIAWAIAFATPFALFAPVGELSSRAGNAGMDVIGLFVLPLAAFFVWSFLVVGSLLGARPHA